MPTAAFVGLWAATHPEDVSFLLRWAVALVVVVTVAVALVVFYRRKRLIKRSFFAESPLQQSAEDGGLAKASRHQNTPRFLGGQYYKRADPEPAGALLPTEWSLQLIELLEWKRFEEICAAYFEAKGRTVEITGLGADGGVDFYIYGQSGNSSRPLGAVQCKAWSSNSVGVKPIRELLGIMTDVGCPLGIFITTTSYTPEAEAFAAGKHIQLLDATRMLDLIKSLPDETQAELLAHATEGGYRTPSCPSCGTKLVLRTAGRGKNLGGRFWGCRNYPRCRYIMQAKNA